MKRIRPLALLLGLITDLVGTFVFGMILGIAALVFYPSSAQQPQARVQNISSDVRFLIVGYLGGIGFTFLGAYLTARLSKPHPVLNTFLFGIISTAPAFLLTSSSPPWYSALCVVTILPVSLVPGYILS